MGQATGGFAAIFNGVVMLARLLSLCLCIAFAPLAFAAPKDDGLALYEKFLASFSADNTEAISALFAPDALFFGTGSAQLVTTPEGVRAYFSSLRGRPADTRARSLSATAVALSDDVVLVSGLWENMATQAGTLVVRGPLRMTMVVARRSGVWTIVQFHNSLQPKPAPAAARP